MLLLDEISPTRVMAVIGLIIVDIYYFVRIFEGSVVRVKRYEKKVEGIGVSQLAREMSNRDANVFVVTDVW